MRKQILLALVSLVMVSCGAEMPGKKAAIREMCTEIATNYPEATLQDVYKSSYQDFFGAEHLVSDTVQARAFLHREIEACREEKIEACREEKRMVCREEERGACREEKIEACREEKRMVCREEERGACREAVRSGLPAYEPTGFRHRFVRANLMEVVEGRMSEEALLTQFMKAAGQGNAYSDNWAEEWGLIEAVALTVKPAWGDKELQESLRQAAAENSPVRHSASFREAYNPHYRLIPAVSSDENMKASK